MAAIVKEFKPNKRYCFSKDRYIKDMGIYNYSFSKYWVNNTDGKEIVNFIDLYTGQASNGMGIDCNWCKIIK